MKITIDWCLKNMQKAYRLHVFDGTIEQFTMVIAKAKEQGIEFTVDIPDELITEIIGK